MNVRFSETYLYKLRLLTNSLDRLFDDVLKQHSNTTLSQFTLLLTITELEVPSQHDIARFMNITPAAVSRQIDLALSRRLVLTRIDPKNRRRRKLAVTSKGEEVIKHGMAALEEHAFKIFENEDASSSLGGHLDMLSILTKEALHDLIK